MCTWRALLSVTTLVLALSFQTCLGECDALLTRIEALEIQGKQQHALIQEQNERLFQQEKTIKVLLEWKEQLGDQSPRDQPGSQHKDVQDEPLQPGNEHTDPHDQPGVENRDAKLIDNGIQERASKEEWTGDRHSGKNARPGRIVLSEGAVAFHAVITSGDSRPLAYGQKVVFDHVNLNLGNGYHNLHGLFIAPAPGIYMFSTSLTSHNADRMLGSIMKNGVELAAAIARSSHTGYRDQGSVTMVTQLAAGDEVWVRHHEDGQYLYGGYYTSFTGCLVTPF